MKIILGSGSKFRKAILERAGYSFDLLVSTIDERAIRTSDPYELPLRLAEAKAQDLLPKISEPSLLITSDTVVICNGRIYEKPLNADEVRAFIRDYGVAGHADIVTSVVVTNTQTGEMQGGIDICKVEFDPIPDEAVEEFIRNGDPYSRAGGFAVKNEALAPYIRTTKGTEDSIMGMPLGLLEELLAKAGQEK